MPTPLIYKILNICLVESKQATKSTRCEAHSTMITQFVNSEECNKKPIALTTIKQVHVIKDKSRLFRNPLPDKLQAPS
ncbi:unnamed protein product [Dovyalis caffra]|uniref:Uncharacterized protein n=1 Tax=Dovyalis caffra TaxID=77055 RepID=A0AAV1S1D1_9ROSI|nr:unnamed protein product [Dovyalis caffra]